jgi:hypothetical protein
MDALEEEKCIKQLKEFAQCFVSPVMNSNMFQFHRELNEYLKDFDNKGWG